MKTLFNLLKIGDRFKTNCYQKTYSVKVSENTAKQKQLGEIITVNILPTAEIIKV